MCIKSVLIYFSVKRENDAWHQKGLCETCGKQRDVVSLWVCDTCDEFEAELDFW